MRALHRRSVKLPEAARQLRLAWTTVRLLANAGDLEVDLETDTSEARFVTRASVVRCWIARNQNNDHRGAVPTIPFADVVRFTGLGRRAVIDLIRAGMLQESPGRRGSCAVTTSSFEDWFGSELPAEELGTSLSDGPRSAT